MDIAGRVIEEQGVPPYVIFGDASLVEMSRKRPVTEADFLEINGVGNVKLERYGAAFLQVIASEAGSLGACCPCLRFEKFPYS